MSGWFYFNLLPPHRVASARWHLWNRLDVITSVNAYMFELSVQLGEHAQLNLWRHYSTHHIRYDPIKILAVIHQWRQTLTYDQRNPGHCHRWEIGLHHQKWSIGYSVRGRGYVFCSFSMCYTFDVKQLENTFVVLDNLNSRIWFYRYGWSSGVLDLIRNSSDV